MTALVCELRFAESPGHFFASTQGGEIVDPAKRVGTVEFDVEGVVLHAFHNAITVCVPSSGNPCELECFLNARPEIFEPLPVAGQDPIQVSVYNLAHLPVGGGETTTLLAVGQQL